MSSAALSPVRAGDGVPAPPANGAPPTSATTVTWEGGTLRPAPPPGGNANTSSVTISAGPQRRGAWNRASVRRAGAAPWEERIVAARGARSPTAISGSCASDSASAAEPVRSRYQSRAKPSPATNTWASPPRLQPSAATCARREDPPAHDAIPNPRISALARRIALSLAFRPDAGRERYHDHRRGPDGPVRGVLCRHARRFAPPHRQPRSGRRPAHGSLPREIRLRRRRLSKDPRQGPGEGDGRAGATMEGTGASRAEGDRPAPHRGQWKAAAHGRHRQGRASGTHRSHRRRHRSVYTAQVAPQGRRPLGGKGAP